MSSSQIEKVHSKTNLRPVGGSGIIDFSTLVLTFKRVLFRGLESKYKLHHPHPAMERQRLSDQLII